MRRVTRAGVVAALVAIAVRMFVTDGRRTSDAEEPRPARGASGSKPQEQQYKKNERSFGRRKIGMSMLGLGACLLVAGFGLDIANAAPPAQNTPPADADTYLKSAHYGMPYAQKREGTDCGFDEVEQPEGKFGWHFVVPAFPVDGAPDLTSFEATFSDAGTITSGQAVQSGKGWLLFTDTADTLEDAYGFSTPDVSPPAQMNLSHTCGPAPQNSSSSSESESSSSSSSEILGQSSEQSSSSEDGAVSGADSEQGAALARTGLDPGVLLMIGGALVVVGVLFVRYSEPPSGKHFVRG